MECIEKRVDLRETCQENMEQGMRQTRLLFQLNHTMPMTQEYAAVLGELFEDRIGEGSFVAAPLQGVCFDQVSIGKNVIVNSNCLMMARGGITIEDEVQIAANAALVSNNHDLYDRMVLTCKPILIKQGAWIGAGATILLGVTVGRYAVVGAASVVTHDVPDYAVVVGNPARVIKTLDASKFPRNQ